MARSAHMQALLLVLGLAGCAHTPPDEPSDPLEPVNRKVFWFNQKADKFVMRPIARTYARYVPQFMQNGVHNFFGNLLYPTVIVNDLLQLKFKQTGQDFARLFLNSTVGIAGFYDYANRLGLQAHDEDFGQTLGHWGVGSGWFLMVPLLGPSSNRDLVGFVGDIYTSPVTYIDNDPARFSLVGMQTLDKRVQYLDADRFLKLQFDPYIFVRTGFLQRRQFLVYDGNPPKEEYDFKDDAPEASLPPDGNTRNEKQ